ncbi:uncharacterized protein MONBRDRAFT_22137 [Monosiga brevicollis MX1]|uniref:Palmitoyltransferase n=1 Tax=Monosiga brevicollis TaxID=81824 RepID=A9UPN8_MONBE|nr:uncharacterized protein MONBRDRAFT_22137 [Monosiga brevicollis MX1]EDQ92455.1 predicted protein [Monosiga brevicollis MX1]|eukprot:XP_001742217.1 hypothetical protein [Monosiga brevicollis MX1]
MWVWSYYVYVVRLCAQAISTPFLAVVYGLLYHVLSAMLLWSYLRAFGTPASEIPPEFDLTDDELEALADGRVPESLRTRRLPILTHDGVGRLRWCRQCRIIKPDRCKHCSLCRRCILKFDHHVRSGVGNCVGHHNYKYFFLFLCYATVFLVYVAATTARYALAIAQGTLDASIQIGFVCLTASLFTLSVGGLLALHISLLRANRTTIADTPSWWHGSMEDGVVHPVDFNEESLWVNIWQVPHAGRPGHETPETEDSDEDAPTPAAGGRHQTVVDVDEGNNDRAAVEETSWPMLEPSPKQRQEVEDDDDEEYLDNDTQAESAPMLGPQDLL